MQATTHIDTDRYAKCIEISRRVRWDIDKDVLRGRSHFSQKFLPDGISKVDQFEFLNADKKGSLARFKAALMPTCLDLLKDS